MRRTHMSYSTLQKKLCDLVTRIRNWFLNAMSQATLGDTFTKFFTAYLMKLVANKACVCVRNRFVKVL